MTKSRSRAFDRHLLDGLSVVSAVVKAGSFARAGESLGLTQLYAYHHSSKHISAKVRAFLDFVIALTRD